MNAVEYTSEALLELEWHDGNKCPLCGNSRPTHAMHCPLNLALAERGFAEQSNRDAARKCLELSRQPTLPPPKG